MRSGPVLGPFVKVFVAGVLAALVGCHAGTAAPPAPPADWWIGHVTVVGSVKTPIAYAYSTFYVSDPQAAYVTRQRVFVVPRGSASAILLAEGVEGALQGDGLREPFAFDADNVYITNSVTRDGQLGAAGATMPPLEQNYALLRIARLGGAPVLLANGPHPFWALALDGGYLYFTGGPGLNLARVAIAGAEVQALATLDSNPRTLAVANGVAYWTHGASLLGVATDGGTPMLLATGDGSASTGVAADSGRVDWSTYIYHDPCGGECLAAASAPESGRLPSEFRGAPFAVS